MRDAQVLLSRGAGRCESLRTLALRHGTTGSRPTSTSQSQSETGESDSRQHGPCPPPLQQARLLHLPRAFHREGSRESRGSSRGGRRGEPVPVRSGRRGSRRGLGARARVPGEVAPQAEGPRPGGRCRLPSWRHTCSRLRRLPIPPGRQSRGSRARIVSPSFAASCSARPPSRPPRRRPPSRRRLDPLVWSATARVRVTQAGNKASADSSSNLYRSCPRIASRIRRSRARRVTSLPFAKPAATPLPVDPGDCCAHRGRRGTPGHPRGLRLRRLPQRARGWNPGLRCRRRRADEARSGGEARCALRAALGRSGRFHGWHVVVFVRGQPARRAARLERSRRCSRACRGRVRAAPGPQAPARAGVRRGGAPAARGLERRARLRARQDDLGRRSAPEECRARAAGPSDPGRARAGWKPSRS